MADLQKVCIHKTLKAIGDKWTPLVLGEIAEGTLRFSSLQKNLESITPRISPRTLSQRLDYLVNEGILSKKAFSEMPPRVEYNLTKKGQDLIPILKQMSKWGTKY